MSYANQSKMTIDKIDVKTLPSGECFMGLDFETLSIALKKLKTTSGYNLYFYLAKNAPNWEFYYSPQDVINFTGMSKSSVSKAKKELIELGFIEEQSNKMIFHARPMEKSFSEETKVSDEKPINNEKVSDEKPEFLRRNSSFSEETKVSQSDIEIDNINNNKEKIDNPIQSLSLSERLEVIVSQFSNGAAARKSFKQLLDGGKTEDWIIAAVNNKKAEVFEKYGFGLLFKADYQQEIDNLLIKKEQAAAAQEEWQKVMFEQSFETIPTQNTFSKRITVSYSGTKPVSSNKQKNKQLIDLNEIANMA